MCIRDRINVVDDVRGGRARGDAAGHMAIRVPAHAIGHNIPVSYTHLRAHETVLDLVCRLLLEKKKKRLTDGTILIYHHRDSYTTASE